MMYKNAVVKGDIVDQVGKRALIIVLAAIVLCNYYMPVTNGEIKPVNDKIGTALICLSMVVLAMLGDKVNSRLRCIPMIVFTAKRTPWLLSSIAGYTNKLTVLILIIMTILPIITCIKMLTIQGDKVRGFEVDSGGDVRFYLFFTLMMDVMFSIPDIVLFTDVINALRLLARCSILIASMILYLPRQGFLNIRRICITFGLFIIIDLFTFGMIKVLSGMITAADVTNASAALTSVFVSLITLLCCMEPKKEPKIEIDEYDCTLGEKLRKSIGWSNDDEERVNRKKYLESAAKRDFVHEYARRFYNNMYYAKDIESIQQRLRYIYLQRAALEDSFNGIDRIKASSLESEGADLLGKLYMVYGFNTGISEC